MAEPFVVNRFFQTPLIEQPLALALKNDAFDQDLNRASEGCSQLIDIAIGMADRFTTDLGGTGTLRYRWEADLWRENPGETRCKPGAFWSFLYFPAGGQVCLNDPRLPTVLAEEGTLRLRAGKTASPEMHEHSVKAGAGTLLMFPGWLSHRIEDDTSVIGLGLWALLTEERP